MIQKMILPKGRSFFRTFYMSYNEVVKRDNRREGRTTPSAGGDR